MIWFGGTPKRCATPASELEAQCYLKAPGGPGGKYRSDKAGDIHIGERIAEVEMIQCVEGLEAKLRSRNLSDAESLVETEILGHQPRAGKDAITGIAGAVCRRRGEGSGIEPETPVGWIKAPVGDAIRRHNALHRQVCSRQ